MFKQANRKARKIRLLSLILCLVMCFSAVVSAEEAPDQAPAEPTGRKDVPFLYADEKNSMPVFFFNNVEEIPFINQYTAIGIINYIFGSSFSMDESDFPMVTFSRDDGGAITIDYVTHEVMFTDFDRFFLSGDGFSAGDLLGKGFFDDDGYPQLIARQSSLNFIRKGYDIVVDLKESEIPLYVVNGETGMMPLQTFNDLFLAAFGWNLLYNGEVVILTYGVLEEGSDLINTYYSVEQRSISPELAKFNHDELSLALDLFYGLKEKHDIGYFDDLFAVTGLKDRLLSTDPSEIDTALLELVNGFFGDLHSGFKMRSPYSDPDSIFRQNRSTALSHSDNMIDRYESARAEAYPDGIPQLEIVDDTLYITFDHFSITAPAYAYYELKDDYDFRPFDTISLIIRAHQIATAENSPVRNIVLDLSNNEGGKVDAAVYVLSWMLGSFHLHSEDTLTEGQYSISYTADVNLDREFDQRDNVSDLNLYCLISPNSFSCGNTVPSVLKASGTVTLMGRTSGGGACIVSSLSTAIGTLLNISDNLRISTVKNGAFYDIDLGVEPDIVLTHPSSFYDREGLTEFIHGLK